MPGPFVYAMFLFVYVCIGAAVLAVAMLLALIPRARPAARWFAGGIIGSYPGVFLFQLAGAPVLVGIVLLMWLLSTVAPNLGPTLPVSLAIFFMLFSLLVSLAGFITGWSVGSAVALGTPVFDAFALTWAGRLLRRLWPVRLE